MAVVFALVFGLAVKWLWNWLMPALFGLGAITYWQAFGIVILTKLLFGSFGHHHDKPDSFKSKFHEKWHRSFGEEDKESMSHEYMQDYHKYYRTYWREEGKKAFEDYVQKIKAQKQEFAKE